MQQSSDSRRIIPDNAIAILESITDGFYSVNTDWEFTYVNQQAGKILDCMPDDLIGKNIWNQFPGLAASEIGKLFYKATQEQVAASVTSFYPDHNRWYEVRVYPAKIGISVYFRNITERVLAEEKLRESESRFRLMADSIPQIVWIVDPVGRIVFCNQQWIIYTGASMESMSPVEMLENFVHPDDTAVTMRAWDAARLDSRVFSVEHRIRSVSGQYRWFLVRAQAHRDPHSGEIVRWFGTSTDVHDRKLAEAALKKSEIRYRSLFESIDEGFCIVEMIFDQNGDPCDYRFCEVNAMFEQQTGLHQAVGKSMRALAPQHEKHWFQIYGKVAVTGEPIRFENEARALNRWFDVYAFRVDEPATRKVAILFKDVTERKCIEKKLQEASQHDSLTGLPNRALLYEYGSHILAMLERVGESGAILFIDLDRFKPVNDMYGHDVGDKLLQEVGRRLAACTRKEDIVCRLGGDEFIVMLPRIASVHDPAIVAQNILDAMAQPILIGTLQLNASSSIGISLFPEHAHGLEDLVRCADLAMYTAKKSGRNSFRIYSPGLSERADDLLRMEALLKHALETNKLALFYQPILDTHSRSLISVEALVRIPAEDGTLLSPLDFVTVAETTGLIDRMGEWVLREACRQHQAWLKEGMPAITVAVNVSPIQFRQPAFISILVNVIQESGIDPAFLQIEVTESTVMDNVPETVATLNQLQSMGIKIALDDFGTGYSSLSHLSSLPLDKLKIDQSFIQKMGSNPSSLSITEAIIGLGRTLNLKVVGEGIESEASMKLLRSYGCDQVQGFLFSKPLPADEFTSWYWNDFSKGSDRLQDDVNLPQGRQ